MPAAQGVWGVSRRQFVAGATAVLGASALRSGAALAAEQWDVIVIGGGSAGLPTALFAAERGARVLLIERSHRLGGTLDRARGQMAAAGTKLQARKDIRDSPEQHFEDIMRISRGTVDQDLTRVFVKHAASTIDWLMDNGFECHDDHPVLGDGHEHFSTPRYLWGKEGSISILKALLPKVEAQVRGGRLSVLYRTDAVELMQDRAAAVTGVVARDAAGVKYDFLARNVVLTTGGCGGNPQLYEKLHGVPLYLRRAYPFNVGGGIELGLAAGGYVRGGDKYLGNFGAVLTDFAFPSPPLAAAILHPRDRQPWEIYVNAHGERFVREDHESVDHREHALLSQPGQRYWAIFDQETLAAAPPFIRGWSRTEMEEATLRHHYFTRADSLTALARKSGFDEKRIVATVERYNRVQAAGIDAEFGRRHMPRPIVKPPFHAVRMQGASILTFAGLGIDTQFRVTRADGSVIPNLYAAGEVIGAGATSGNSVVGGMLITPALTFGRLIGQNLRFV